MMRPALSAYGTDKTPIGYFEAIYDGLLDDSRACAMGAVLEIGVHQGESLRLWHDWFPHARIYGVDQAVIDWEALDRVTVLDQHDAYAAETVQKLRALEPKGYDLIIDDGPHNYDSQAFTLTHYAPLLSDSGVLVVEDIVSADYVARLAALPDHRHWTTRVVRMNDYLHTDELKKTWFRGLFALVLQRRTYS